MKLIDNKVNYREISSPEKDKCKFYDSINAGTKFDIDFFKKVYGYSLYDKEFLTKIVVKLDELKKGDVCRKYNEWFAIWYQDRKAILRDVSRQYQKQLDEEWKGTKKNWEKVNDQWRQDKIQLLQKKKELLAKKKELLNSLN